MNIIKKIILSLATVLSLSGFVFAGQVASAACNDSAAAAIGCGANNASGQSGTPADAEGSLNHTIQTVINILSVIVGVIAVIMIIIGGLRYITSAGNDTGIASAKKTILYALIGLVIVALAQIIVKFVLNKATEVPKKTSYHSKLTRT